MKRIINTLAAKYVVNTLLIVLFAAMAITGLFFMEGGGRHERGNKIDEKQFYQELENSGQIDMHGFSDLERRREFRGRQDGGSEDIHQIAGIAWLVLMFLHTIQHWNWYKKLFAPKHFMQNKLLTATVILFVLLTLTSIALLTEILPRGFFDIKEIHGFFGQVIVGLVIIHIIQRFKWYITVTRKLFQQKIVVVSTI